ncbi:MAG: phosphopyruvate hydratase [Magnetovibrio sp.]|nr:phosphopyruvate hydratase [Magnetovibrio sp.]
MSDTEICNLRARRIWDSRGHPTIEVEIYLKGGAVGRGIAPSGASCGTHEAKDLRDGGSRFGGYDVTRAIQGIELEIAEILKGQDASNQRNIDRLLIELDGTPDKKRLGGNATIATSFAAAHAVANAQNMPLWRYLGGENEAFLPLPEIQIFGGGVHANNRVDIQDFMVIPVGARRFSEALNWTAEVYIAARKLLEGTGKLVGVADEGGFWPMFDSNEDGIRYLVQAIEDAGFTPGQDIAISLDVAASEFYKNGRYRLMKEDADLDSDGLCAMLINWIERYPICSIEDPLAENDFDGMVRFTWAVRNRVQVIGDDFLVTNAKKIRAAIASHACNALLVKPNQAGTLTETRAAFETAKTSNMGCVVSARSGETEDTSIIHLAVGWGAPQIKVGSFSRSERMAKWNEGLRIEEALQGGFLPPRSIFPWR